MKMAPSEYAEFVKASKKKQVERKAKMRSAVSTLLSATAKRNTDALIAFVDLGTAVSSGIEALRRLQECERVLRRLDRLTTVDGKKAARDLRYALEGEWA